MFHLKVICNFVYFQSLKNYKFIYEYFSKNNVKKKLLYINKLYNNLIITVNKNNYNKKHTVEKLLNFLLG